MSQASNKKSRQNRRPIMEVEVSDLTFRAPNANYRDQRVATLQTEFGETSVYPTFVFNPKAGKDYPCLVRVYRLFGDRLHGVASPLTSAILDATELLPAMQSVRRVCFDELDEGRLGVRDGKTGMYIVPADSWEVEMRAIYRDAGINSPTEDQVKPAGGVEYVVVCEEHPNKLVAHPTPPAEMGVQTQALTRQVENAGIRSDFEDHHVLSPDGRQWIHIVTLLRVDDEDLKNSGELKRAYRRESSLVHPDKWANKSPALQKVAADKFGLIKAAYEKAKALNERRTKSSPEDAPTNEADAKAAQAAATAAGVTDPRAARRAAAEAAKAAVSSTDHQ